MRSFLLAVSNEKENYYQTYFGPTSRSYTSDWVLVVYLGIVEPFKAIN